MFPLHCYSEVSQVYDVFPFPNFLLTPFLFFMILNTRLKLCLKGCYFCILDAIKQLCGIRFVHGLPRKPFRGRARRDEGSWAALGRWRDALERWWMRKSGEFLTCISHLFSYISHPGMYIHMYSGIWMLPLSWHHQAVQVFGFFGWTLTEGMAQTTKEDLSVPSWVRTVLWQFAVMALSTLWLPIFVF